MDSSTTVACQQSRPGSERQVASRSEGHAFHDRCTSNSIPTAALPPFPHTRSEAGRCRARVVRSAAGRSLSIAPLGRAERARRLVAVVDALVPGARAVPAWRPSALGRPRALRGDHVVVFTGIAQQNLPRELGCSPATARRRLREWPGRSPSGTGMLQITNGVVGLDSAPWSALLAPPYRDSGSHASTGSPAGGSTVATCVDDLGDAASLGCRRSLWPNACSPNRANSVAERETQRNFLPVRARRSRTRLRP
jgi:hypothetical protein